MKRRMVLIACVYMAAAFLGTGDAAAQMKKGATVWPAADVKWMEMKGGPPGIMYADLWGHVEKGAYGSLIKLPAGMNNPLHTHTSDIKLIVFSGTFWYAPEGGAKVELGPGSYLLVPGGLKHTSGTGAGAPCEVFQESSGKFDLLPVSAPAK